MSLGGSHLEFDANASKAQAELRKLLESVDRLDRGLKKMNTSSAEGARKSTKAFKDTAKTLDTIKTALGAIGIAGAMRRIVDLQIEWNRELQKTLVEQDKIGRKLQVQGLLNDKAFQQALRQRIAPSAQAAAVPLQQAQMTATELISQGFSNKQATGAALREILLGAQATNSGDSAGFGRSIAAFLKSQGRSLTAGNVRSVTAPVRSLFGKTALQPGDLENIASSGALLKEFGLQQEDIFASATLMKDIGGAEPSKAVRQVRGLVTILGGSGGNKETLETLDKIGGPALKEKVDLVGESFPEALGNLKAALDGLDKPSYQAALTKLFGRENVEGASTLLSNLDKYGDFVKKQGDQSELGKAVSIATSGPAASSVRLTNAVELAKLQEAQKSFMKSQWLSAMEAIETEEGVPAALRMSRKYIRSAGNAAGLDMPGLEVAISRLENWGRAGGMYERRVVEGVARTNASIGASRLPQVGAPTFATGGDADRRAGGRSIDFFGESEGTPDAADVEYQRAQVNLARAEFAAEQPGSPHGKVVDHEESRQIALLQQVVDELKLSRAERALEKEEKKLRRSPALAEESGAFYIGGF